MMGIANRKRFPRGFTAVELIVAAGLIVATIPVLATLTVRAGRMWRQTEHVELAIDELSLHVERLTSIDPASVDRAITRIRPTTDLDEALKNVRVSGQRFTDELGDRIVVSIDWQRVGDPPPLRLVGWIRSAANPSKESDR